MQQYENLDQVRSEIDRIDTQILALLSERANCSLQVAEFKREATNPVFYRPEREMQILQRLVEITQGSMPDKIKQTLLEDSVWRVFKEVMSTSLALQMPLQIACLGPAGTFSEQAVYRQFGHAVDAVPQSEIEDVFRAVEAGSCHYGMVPVENSTGGAIVDTLDRFLDSSLQIIAECYLRIHQHFCSTASSMGEVTEVFSHQASLRQCRTWLTTHLPQAKLTAVRSNAEAARLAAQSSTAAAICGRAAAAAAQLPLMSENVEDDPNNTTRFFVLGKQAPEPSGQDKTTFVVAITNRSGALHRILEPLARHKVSMTRIESRPSRQGLWDYAFFIDIEGHEQDPAVQAAFAELVDETTSLRKLGSYPAGRANEH